MQAKSNRGSSHEFVRRFEGLDIPAGSFHHKEHIFLAWLYLQDLPLHEVLQRYPIAIKRYAKHVGADDLYHETITFAFLFLINERVEENQDADWDTFCSDNPDLFERDLAAILRYYSPELLFSDRAKRMFVMPDIASGRAT